MKENKHNKQFQKLIEQHKGILLKVARTYCQDEDDRQDLIQEIMLQLWQSFHKYNEKGFFYTCKSPSNDLHMTCSCWHLQ